MDYLHAYWRIEYLETPKDKNGNQNPFAHIYKENDDKKNLILIRGEYHYVVMNRYPYNAGHLMVIPYREVPDIEDLTDGEQAELMKLLIRSKRMLKAAIKPDGFNVGMNLGSAAGAGIPQHLHCHIVPRWVGDTNFMPVLGKNRVLPTALEIMWERLSEFTNQ